jgi:hypothetical protein
MEIPHQMSKTESQTQNQHLSVSATSGNQHQSAPTQKSEYSKVTS